MFEVQKVIIISLSLIFLVCTLSEAATARAVIISPHNQSIRFEFGRAFSRWHETKFGETAEIEWRDLGGTSDAQRFVISEFKSKPDGIGIDCFFGGGLGPYLSFKEKGLLSPVILPDEVIGKIPENIGGVPLYDEGYYWFGAAISGFGILQNSRVLERLRLPLLDRWEQLSLPVAFGWVGAADPRNSGTMNVMYETFLQAYGWERGWQLLTALGGNVKNFNRYSSNTAKGVTLGETAYGLAIDFYGFTQVAAAGKSNMVFVLPSDIRVISPDAIALFKGAPHPVTATRFIRFVLSEPGQKLWFLRKGHPEGAQFYSIERMSVRPDFYDRFGKESNIEYSPFKPTSGFTYDAELARERRGVVSSMVGALLVDTHTELKETWKMMIEKDAVEEKSAALGLPPITEEEALALANGEWQAPRVRNRKKIEWQVFAIEKYSRIKSALKDN